MKVGIAVWGGPNSYHADAVRPVTNWHKGRGHDVEHLQLREGFAKGLKGKDLVYFWNGEYPWMKGHIHEVVSNGGTAVFAEVAWFPQKEFTYYDQLGTNGNCSLHFDDLSWLEEEDYNRLDALSEKYRGGLEPTKEGYILVPLQLSHDTAIQRWSPLKKMGDVIKMARSMFPDKKILFRRHPKDKCLYPNLIPDPTEANGPPLKELIMGADLVWGMNSTVLTEAALMGKDVITCGKSLLDIGTNRRDALAALVARQVPRDVDDITPWTRRGRGLEHLSSL